MHYESYHWQDHAPNPYRGRVDLALTIAFAVVFSIGSVQSFTGSHGMSEPEAQPFAQAALDTFQLAKGDAATHTACRG